eukprot:TRINITY_DN12833_c0_g1_i1.p1 TRINITY_DN12833_c0_g1~~TRINITY_DN12833_c0_g1_i1.p1  ORF type:complete len:492 (+),score=102.82 TRINITY_DN12833_c0_g1_i1:67-1542(+)
MCIRDRRRCVSELLKLSISTVHKVESQQLTIFCLEKPSGTIPALICLTNNLIRMLNTKNVYGEYFNVIAHLIELKTFHYMKKYLTIDCILDYIEFIKGMNEKESYVVVPNILYDGPLLFPPSDKCFPYYQMINADQIKCQSLAYEMLARFVHRCVREKHEMKRLECLRVFCNVDAIFEIYSTINKKKYASFIIYVLAVLDKDRIPKIINSFFFRIKRCPLNALQDYLDTLSSLFRVADGNVLLEFLTETLYQIQQEFSDLFCVRQYRFIFYIDFVIDIFRYKKVQRLTAQSNYPEFKITGFLDEISRQLRDKFAGKEKDDIYDYKDKSEMFMLRDKNAMFELNESELQIDSQADIDLSAKANRERERLIDLIREKEFTLYLSEAVEPSSVRVGDRISFVYVAFIANRNDDTWHAEVIDKSASGLKILHKDTSVEWIENDASTFKLVRSSLYDECDAREEDRKLLLSTCFEEERPLNLLGSVEYPEHSLLFS